MTTAHTDPIRTCPSCAFMREVMLRAQSFPAKEAARQVMVKEHDAALKAAHGEEVINEEMKRGNK